MSGFNQGIRIGGGFASRSGFQVGFTRDGGVVTQGLVLHLDIGNQASYPGSGATVFDIVGNSNATLTNAPTYSDGYLTFNGTNQYLITSTSLEHVVLTDIVTISIWAYPRDNGVILSERGQLSPVGWHDSQMEMVSGVMKFGMWQESGHSPIVTSSVATPLNAWYNFVIVYDGTKMLTYVNGTPAGEATFARENPVETGNGLFYVVASSETTNLGDGTYASMRLGQLLVYNRALSSSEVVRNYTASRSRFA